MTTEEILMELKKMIHPAKPYVNKQAVIELIQKIDSERTSS